MNSWVSGWTKKRYKEVCKDLCTCFIKRGFSLSDDRGYEALITSDTCMYISSFQKMRKEVIERTSIVCFIDTRGINAHPDVFDANAGWVLWNHPGVNIKGSYFKLNHPIPEKGQRLLEALANPDCGWFYQADADGFGAIPGSPIAYWASKAMMDAFVFGDPLNTLAYGCNGITTGENERFLRQWFEVSHRRIAFNLSQSNDLGAIDAWVPYNKGGDFLKWASHLDYVIDWRKKGSIISEYGHLVMRSKRYMLRSGLTWPKISSGHIAMRRVIEGFMFDVAGLSLFPENINLTQYLEAFVNSSVATAFLSFLSPTLNFEVGNVTSLPIIKEDKHAAEIKQLATECELAACQSRDYFETSWNFRGHPLI